MSARQGQHILVSWPCVHQAFENSPGSRLCLLLLQGVSAGQNTTLISLDQAIDLALAHNHALKATRTLILQNQAQEITANLRPNPTLGADSQFIPIFTPQDFSADELNLDPAVRHWISYLFERGHKRQRRLQAARDQTAVPAPRWPTPSAAWLRCGPTICQRAAGGIYSAVRPGGLEGFQATVDIAERSSRRASSAKATF